MTWRLSAVNNIHLQNLVPHIGGLDDYEEQVRSNDGGLSYRDWIRQRRIKGDDKATHRGKLIKNRQSNGADLILDIAVEKTLQIHLIWWRKGMFGWKANQACPVCLQAYSQRHIYDCMEHPDNTIEALIDAKQWDTIGHWITLWWSALGRQYS